MWARAETPGQYAFFNATACPAGWLAADGTNGTVDLRGEFIRGWDNGRGVDFDRGLAVWQIDELRSHTHYLSSRLAAPGAGVDVAGPNPTGGWGLVTSTGGSETRPRNVALLACMKL